MILVLSGTQNNDFSRLLREIERNIDKSNIEEEVVVRAGFTKYASEKMKIFDMISTDKINELIDEASFIITHAGVGSIINSLKKGKKVIAVPRLQEYNEHVNNHQLDIVSNFNDKGYIVGIKDVRELEDALKRIKEFNPKEYISNTENIIKIIEDFIG
jgi:UDP-N-acetylglucosamine transferase subunit ALG13